MINLRKGFRFLFLIAFFVLASSLPLGAKQSLKSAGTYYYLGVPNYTQQPYNQLCWATTASMIIAYFNGGYVDRVTIAQSYYGSNFNYPGYDYMIRNPIYSYTGWYGTITGAISYGAVQSQINRGGPIVIMIFWTSGGGHFLVCRGYYPDYSYILVNDPWDGSTYWYNYSYYVSNSSFRWGESITFK
jgi:hypothetical protein